MTAFPTKEDSPPVSSSELNTNGRRGESGEGKRENRHVERMSRRVGLPSFFIMAELFSNSTGKIFAWFPSNQGVQKYPQAEGLHNNILQ